MPFQCRGRRRRKPARPSAPATRRIPSRTGAAAREGRPAGVGDGEAVLRGTPVTGANTAGVGGGVGTAVPTGVGASIRAGSELPRGSIGPLAGVASEVGRSTARRRGRSREEGAPAGEKIVACTRRSEPAAYENARTTPAAAFQARTRGNLLRLDARLMKGRVEIARKRSASNMKRLLAVSGLALAALLISTLAASA